MNDLSGYTPQELDVGQVPGDPVYDLMGEIWDRVAEIERLLDQVEALHAGTDEVDTLRKRASVLEAQLAAARIRADRYDSLMRSTTVRWMVTRFGHF